MASIVLGVQELFRPGFRPRPELNVLVETLSTVFIAVVLFFQAVMLCGMFLIVLNFIFDVAICPVFLECNKSSLSPSLDSDRCHEACNRTFIMTGRLLKLSSGSRLNFSLVAHYNSL